MYNIQALDENAVKAFSPAEKIGLVGTVNAEGQPHLTLITSIRAPGPKQITLGEFSKGKSKENLQQNPRAAFLVMTMDRRMWRGHARWTHLRTEGPEYQAYNDLPMFRYNAYLGIGRVHYLDLVDARGAEALPLPSIILSVLMTRLARRRAAAENS
ncbi:MAG: pyridoxamine 5'-phosphate oxidase family protein, partial [Thermodesulfobacteriota bacterium]